MKRTLIIIGVIVVTALQIEGPYLFGFGNWCNIIQYTSGFSFIGTAYVAIDYLFHHKKRIHIIEEHLKRLLTERGDVR